MAPSRARTVSAMENKPTPRAGHLYMLALAACMLVVLTAAAALEVLTALM